MYLVDPSGLAPDIWSLMRSTMQLLQRGLLCLTAFLASASVFTDGASSKALGVQGVSGQYLLGLGIGDITGPVVETNMMVSRTSARRARRTVVEQRRNGITRPRWPRTT
ncbi:hypothetical protein GY45DRAFT_322040 [Cubamyces sp. BRFM 1775]|nr:hypothetical protein GY45DRAFT_322040 [Cubamyces sp. BRFM 1775]